MEGGKGHLKVVVCGAAGVGKSSLLQRLCENTFSEKHTKTIGVNVFVHTVGDVTMQVWDTAGQERYRAMVKTHFRGARLILFAFDVSNRLSLEMVPEWIEEAGWGSDPDQLAILVGTKSDTPPNKRAVPEEEAAEYAHECNMPYMETSARTGERVVELFAEAARLLRQQPPPLLSHEKDGIVRGTSLYDGDRPHVVHPQKPPSSGCCK
jgi:small GTP-binding protein